MTDVAVKPIEPGWTTVHAIEYQGWISDLCCQPDMDNPDQFILTMDGPRGGEHARIRVSRFQLLDMIVRADKERQRVNIVRQSS